MAATTLRVTQTIGSTTLTITLITTQGTLACDNAQASELVSKLYALYVTLDLTSFRFMHTTGSNYTYTFTASDGRTWLQTLTFTPPQNPKMTFSTSAWNETEFLPHRRIRELIILLHQTLDLDDVEVGIA